MDECNIRVVPKPWNKGKLVGQKTPLKLKEIWAIRVRLQVFSRKRELALFDLGIDSKLRACDLLKLKVRDLCHGERVAARAIVVQQKTWRPVQFEITESTRTALVDWISLSGLASDDFLFPSRVHAFPSFEHPTVCSNCGFLGRGNRSRSGRLRNPFRPPHQAVSDLSTMGHTKLESTVRYLGIEVEDALELAEQTEA
jgi:hypothetical protein